ncbi:uncharacterized protein LOC115764447 [Drosophila novamexicana]|uniref:uncharacterized protein LOC115764447 n=1 Tax=Drosophila novamexicana TaxID=47314 RepID=UPI0011E5FFF9|nr:uncharacterized protein LOC115764447 [Drosophila novamexicana]
MSMWKQVSGRSRCLLGKAGILNSVGLRRFSEKGHNPTPTCMERSKISQQNTDACVDDHPKARKAENIEETFPFYNLIKFSKDCCEMDCAELEFPGFDKCLYKESDKNKRKYQITWVECPPIEIKPKKICCHVKDARPPFERRKPKERPSTACKPPVEKCEELECPKLTMPHCRPVRVPVKCQRIRYPSDCVKVKAPYPAFSECSRPKLRKRRRSECHCWDEIPMCELLRVLNRRLITGNISMNPCKP